VDKIPDATDVTLWGRPELSAVVKESTGKPYNEKVYGQAFFVNARARPTMDLLSRASRSEPFVALAGKELVAARLDTVPFDPGVVTKSAVSALAKRVKSAPPPPEPLFAGYWDLVESNGLAIADQARRFEDPLTLPRSVEVRGPSANVMVDAGAEVEGTVTFDARLGPIMIEKGAAVESFSRVMGPCYVGPRAKILSALIGGGTSIFESCKVGGQVENSILSPFTNKAHHGYVGDSYVGSWVNLGAGCTFSNLKNTYGNVRLEMGGKKLDSGMVKLGPVIGDMAKLSIGSMVFAGRAVGTGSHVFGLAAENVPSFTFYGSGKPVELKLESVMLTQRRMMERRGMAPSRAEESLVRRAFQLTSAERRRAGVKKGVIT
jgi:UDP-N-acetylglucosamine diphosphorylase / glucose-1-phosphate thymidylyltransferase / UDP-N-acetylgalactosamine diphosphorylase / glucosamine-1-phosphate N-acetyltransferase / galactosamine-1-phosphate N-acetyltransferase